MTIALKEIHISNEKKRDASVRFVSLIKENDPKLAYKGKTIKNTRLLISSDETSEESLINKYKSKLAENILKNDDYGQIIEHLRKLNYDDLNKYFQYKDISKIIFYMKQDKKNRDTKINLILLKSIAKPILNKSFREKNIRSFLKTLIY